MQVLSRFQPHFQGAFVSHVDPGKAAVCWDEIEALKEQVEQATHIRQLVLSDDMATLDTQYMGSGQSRQVLSGKGVGSLSEFIERVKAWVTDWNRFIAGSIK